MVVLGGFCGGFGCFGVVDPDIQYINWCPVIVSIR